MLLYIADCIFKTQQWKLRDDGIFVPQRRGWTGRHLYCSSIHPNSPPAPAL